MIFEFIILIIIGSLSGLLTGLIGLSAVTVSAPILVIFGGYNIYVAIGISLTVDVFASLTATAYYWRKKNVDWKEALIILSLSFVGVIIGSYFSSLMSNLILLICTAIGICFYGYDLLKKGITKKEGFLSKIKYISKKRRNILFVIGSIIIGLNAGFFGAGGGLMILFLLTYIKKFKIHKAIGTSVLAMTFIALLSSYSHYLNTSFPLSNVFISGLFSIIGAIIAARFANKIKSTKLQKIAGSTILFLGFLLILKNLINF